MQKNQITTKCLKHLTLLITYHITEFLFNINKPAQVRVVYVASAKYYGTCLNENLLPILDLLNNLISVLTRFLVKVPLDETDALEIFVGR